MAGRERKSSKKKVPPPPKKQKKSPRITGDHIPSLYAVVDECGREVGRVKRGVVKRDKKALGAFRRKDGKLYYVLFNNLRQPTQWGIVDNNNNIWKCDDKRYMGTVVRRKPVGWVPFILTVALFTIASILVGAWYVRQIRDYVPTFFVAEEGGDKWDEEKNLNVFENGYYEDMKIHPGMEGDYQFRIKNENGKKLTYDLEFAELNEYDVNLHYRLRLNNVYIAGSEDEYVSVSELTQKGLILADDSAAIFTLEWKWIDDEGDTNAGMNQANYTLIIFFSAEIPSIFT